MKIRVLSFREEIDTLDEDEKFVHFSFRPTNVDLLELVMRCPDIKAIQLSKSYMKTVSVAAKRYLSQRNIALIEGEICGQRKNIHEYSIISSFILERISSLLDEGSSKNDVAKTVSKETGLSYDLINSILSDLSNKKIRNTK